jgi:hypothetical protein
VNISFLAELDRNCIADHTVPVAGNARIRESNSMKFGGTGASDAKFEIKYNASTETLDFNFIGA